MKVYAILLAAGSGNRFGGLKQTAEFKGVPIFLWTISALESVADCVLVIGPQVLEGLAEARQRSQQIYLRGGTTRIESITIGLLELVDRFNVRATDTILIVDGNRPLTTPEIFRRCAEEALRFGVACPALPVVDGIAVVTADTNSIAHIPAKQDLVAIQTPEGIRGDLLDQIMPLLQEENAPLGVAEAAFKIGLMVRVFPGSLRGYKVTHPYDIEVLATIDEILPP